ncbi:MAG: NUDIX domain-containing protein [Candidatus Taylorbacteria bacterium]
MSNVIWVDENDAVLGEVDREKAHKEGLLHRVAAIYLVNDRGEILVNERAKDGYLDHSSAGHVDVGESYLEAAKRELEEELGVLGVDLQDIGLAGSQGEGEIFKRLHMFRVYVCKATPVKLKEDEVKRVFWANPKDIAEDMKVNPKKYTGGFMKTLKLFLSAT